MMTKIKIVNIEAKPWWKFWILDNLQVTVEDGRGEQETFTIHSSHRIHYSKRITRDALKQGIAEKYCTGDQFWSLPQVDYHSIKLKSMKTKKVSKEVLLNELMDLRGDTFDCVLVLSKEAEVDE